MEVDMRRFAWIAGATGAALVVAFLVHHYAVGQTDTTWGAVGGVGAALLALYLWLDREDLEAAANTPAARYGSMAGLTVAVALGVAVALNVMANRYDERWDATATGAHTLADQSVKIAAGLARDVTVLGFFPAGSPEGDIFRDRIEAFQEHTDRLTLERVDPLRNPMLANEYDIRSEFGTVVLVSGEDRQRLEGDYGEEAMVNALVRLTSEREHLLCFTEGHGEREVDDETSAEGVGGLVLRLEGQNYTVKTFLPLRDQVPQGCEAVILVDPQEELLAPELEILSRYALGGGKIIVLAEPLRAEALVGWLRRFGIRAGADIVLEDNPSYQLMGGDASYLILDQDSYEMHPLTESLRGIALMRVARSMSMTAAAVEGVQVQLLARTSERGWGETDLMSGAPPAPDPEVDLVGRVPLIAAAEIVDPSGIPVGATTLPPSGDGLEAPAGDEAPPDDARQGDGAWRAPGGAILAFGDSDFVSNSLLIEGNNQDLIMNAIAWAVGEEDQLAIRVNEAGRGSLTMTDVHYFLVLFICLAAAPFFALLGGVLVWVRRKRL